MNSPKSPKPAALPERLEVEEGAHRSENFGKSCVVSVGASGNRLVLAVCSTRTAAEKLVDRYNRHAELVAAVRKASDILADVCDGRGANGETPEVDAAFDLLTSALTPSHAVKA
jgi:hypothetical protein